MLKGFWLENLKERDRSEDMGVHVKDNIKTNRTEIGPEDVEWSHVAQCRSQWRTLAHKVMNFKVPQSTENFLPTWGNINFSRRTLFYGVKPPPHGCARTQFHNSLPMQLACDTF